MEAQTRPSAEAVAHRALSLVSVLFRDNLERAIALEQRPRAVVEKLNTLLKEWMDREGVRERLSKRESALMEIALGGWDDRAVADISWRVEAVGMLLWSVGVIDAVAPYDQMFALEDVMPTLGVFSETAPLMGRLSARSDEVLQRQRDIAEVWHWRARAAELQRRSGLAPAPQNLQNALGRAQAAGAFDSVPSCGDLLAFGKPYRELTAEEATTCAVIARERYLALNWMCGRSADWDETAIDT